MRHIDTIMMSMNQVKAKLIACPDELERMRLADQGLSLVDLFFKTPIDFPDTHYDRRTCRYCGDVKEHKLFVKGRDICNECDTYRKKYKIFGKIVNGNLEKS